MLKHSCIRVVKTFVTNNRQTSVLRDLRGTHKSREFSVMYLIGFNLLSHLQLIRPLYELFLEIKKPIDPCRKCQEVTPTDKATITKNFSSGCWGRNKHNCDQHRPFCWCIT